MSRREMIEDTYVMGRASSDGEVRANNMARASATIIADIPDTQIDVCVVAAVEILGRSELPLTRDVLQACFLGLTMPRNLNMGIGLLATLYELGLYDAPDPLETAVAALREIAESTFPLTSSADGVVDEFSTPDAGKAIRALIAMQLMDPEEDPNL